jgi:hypothetical protein
VFPFLRSLPISRRDRAGKRRYKSCRMIEFIESVEGVDTVALESRHPELFNVSDKDGVKCWSLRPDVLAILRRVSRTSRTVH